LNRLHHAGASGAVRTPALSVSAGNFLVGFRRRQPLPGRCANRKDTCMSVSIDWADKAHTSVVYTFSGKWTWDEFYDCWAWLRTAMDSADAKVSVIMDVRATRYVPPDVFNHIRAILMQLHPNFSRAA